MPYIEIGGETRSVGPGVLTIGAGTEAGWRIQGHGLHPVHLMIVPEADGRFSLIQGAPDAAIRVNDAELENGWHPLAAGDEVRFGDLTALFRLVSREAETSGEGYLRDTRRGRLYRITGGSRIGRDLSSTVLLQEPDVSRIHAEIAVENGNFVVHPHGVTLLNGRPLGVPAPLREGDELVVGRTYLRFSREVPRSVVVDAQTRPNTRVSQMRTTFMGTVEMHDYMQKSQRRRIGRAAVVVLAAAAIVLGLMSLWGATPTSAETPPGNGATQVRMEQHA
jgi:predicted component of type VI protein secretion system